MNIRQYNIPLRKNTSRAAIILAVAMGMGGELHVQAPGIGVVAMFDFLSYFIAVPILLMNWTKMGRFMRRSLKWAFAWTAASMIANALNFMDMRYWLKCVALASSSWSIMAASYVLLKKDARLYLWYIVGAGIGGWVALYYFRNGAIEYFAAGGADYFGRVGADTSLLLEKQIYPSVARGVLQGMVLPLLLLFDKFPFLVILCATFVGGFWLLFHGGSRSSFGIFTASAIVGFAALYMKNLYVKVSKSKAGFIIIVALGIGLIFGVYKSLAESEVLGEGEMHKYEAEFGEGGRGVALGRASFDVAFENAIDSCGIGLGWHLRCHSVMANSLACEGFIGFLFWVYFYLECLWFVCRRMPYSSKYATFIMLMILSACWDVFGSPFGTRHKFFVLMSFIALCHDDTNYGRDALFVNMPWNAKLLA